MRYTEEKIIEMLNKGSVRLDNEDIIELIEYKNELLNNARLTNEQLYEEMRERMDEEVRIATRLGYHSALEDVINELLNNCVTKFDSNDYVEVDDIKSTIYGLKQGAKREVKLPKMIRADDIFKKFSGHSDYHGDTILSIIKCMSEGKEVESAIPLNTDEIKLKAIKWAFEKIREKIKRFHYLGFPASSDEFKYAMCVEDCDLNEIEKYFEGVYSVQ